MSLNNVKKFKKIALIGAGNVATQLGLVLQKKDYEIIQVYSRTEKSAKAAAKKFNTDYCIDINEISKNADLYFLAVKDDAIEEIIKKLKLQDKLLVHTSGSTLMNILQHSTKNYGVFYPLQTFSKTRKVNFKNIPICIEANTKVNEEILFSLAHALSDVVLKINSEQRETIHLAAVFACNFTNHLFSIAEEILTQQKLSLDILKPLIRETVNKIKKNSPKEMQTGPAIRGDKKIMQKQLQLLKKKNDYKKIYELLSKDIISMHKTKKLS